MHTHASHGPLQRKTNTYNAILRLPNYVLMLMFAAPVLSNERMDLPRLQLREARFRKPDLMCHQIRRMSDIILSVRRDIIMLKGRFLTWTTRKAGPVVFGPDRHVHTRT